MGYIRRFLLALIGVVLVTACSDIPTGSLPPTADLDPTSVPHLNEAEGCVSDGFCILPPFTGGCDPWTSLDWCAGECEESAPGSPEVVGAEGCSDPGEPGPGGGGPAPPPPGCPTWDPYCENQPPSADTCNTGDPVIDSPAVQGGFAELWAQSNPDQPMENRVERGGWMVPDGAGGYRIEPFQEVSSNACEILLDLSTLPAGAVAFVHTHPYESGVPMRVCEGEMIFGRLVYETYTNEPSDFDGRAASTLGMPGYIIDYDKITKFTGSPTSRWQYEIVSSNTRCGY